MVGLPNKQRGFTYLGILFAVVLFGVSLAMVGVVWRTSQQRESEQELLFVGDQYRRAIMLYYERTPGTVKQYPKSLDQLIEDNRFIVPQRYLRKLYLDPVTGKREWGTISAIGGGIMGIYSLSDKTPIKVAHFPEIYSSFTRSKSYKDWKFSYTPAFNPVNNSTK